MYKVVIINSMELQHLGACKMESRIMIASHKVKKKHPEALCDEQVGYSHVALL